MRLLVNDGVASTGLLLIACGGGSINLWELAGMYQWAARLLIVTGVVFCGIYVSRRGAAAGAAAVKEGLRDANPERQVQFNLK